MLSVFGKAKEILLDILFPPLCSLCRSRLTTGEKERLLCGDCFDAMPINTSLTCPICKSRLANNKKTCHKNSAFRLAAATFYENSVAKNLIHQFKYQKTTALAKPLAELMFTHLKNLNLKLNGYALVPIPLHPARQRERGFNQAELLTDILSVKTNLPVIKNSLLRTKNCEPQAATHSLEERLINIKNSFAIKNPESLAKKNIILVDDVFTSGATINEAVKALRQADVQKIIALVGARAGF